MTYDTGTGLKAKLNNEILNLYYRFLNVKEWWNFTTIIYSDGFHTLLIDPEIDNNITLCSGIVYNVDHQENYSYTNKYKNPFKLARKIKKILDRKGITYATFVVDDEYRAKLFTLMMKRLYGDTVKFYVDCKEDVELDSIKVDEFMLFKIEKA